MTGHEFKGGDCVRVLDRCQFIKGNIVELCGSFVRVEYASSIGDVVTCITLTDRVFHHDDVAGFVAHVRDQANWLQRQADALELSSSTAP